MNTRFSTRQNDHRNDVASKISCRCVKHTKVGVTQEDSKCTRRWHEQTKTSKPFHGITSKGHSP